MNLDILEKKMPEAIKYASNIITETPNFIEFAIALTDYMGIKWEKTLFHIVNPYI